jgi:hypothetical protein
MAWSLNDKVHRAARKLLHLLLPVVPFWRLDIISAVVTVTVTCMPPPMPMQANEVRLAAIVSFLEIYQDGNDKELDTFSKRFKKRFVQMITDTHDPISVPAAQVCIFLAK